jgi:DNA-binding Lrp family transcriptional regulator
MSTPQRNDMLELLRDGERSTGELVERLGMHRTTVRRRLSALVDAGEAEMTGWGRYRIRGAKPILSDTGSQVLAIVERLFPDAHLTGFDLLAPYAHQFFAEYPHLVYTEPASLDATAYALVKAGFVVLSPAQHHETLRVPSLSRVVILRAQPNPEQYSVRGACAPREKAWVDTLRESRRGNLPIDIAELSRVLHNLLDAGGDLRKLHNYARRMGYLDHLTTAIAGWKPQAFNELDQ